MVGYFVWATRQMTRYRYNDAQHQDGQDRTLHRVDGAFRYIIKYPVHIRAAYTQRLPCVCTEAKPFSRRLTLTYINIARRVSVPLCHVLARSGHVSGAGQCP